MDSFYFKLCQTSIITTTLILWTEQKTKKRCYSSLVILSLFFSLILQAIILAIDEFSLALHKQQQFIHFALSIVMLLNGTKVTFDILSYESKSKSPFSTLLWIILFAVCFMFDQGLYLQCNQPHNLMLGLLFYLVTSLVYYAFMTAISNHSRIMKCLYSIPICFTSAIFLSRFFGYLELHSRQANLLEIAAYHTNDSLIR